MDTETLKELIERLNDLEMKLFKGKIPADEGADEIAKIVLELEDWLPLEED